VGETEAKQDGRDDATSLISTEEPVMDMRKFGKKKNLIFSFFGLRILILKKK
jgi:hypothetical protein